jgi:4-carboxymuconolactone decarboxylase
MPIFAANHNRTAGLHGCPTQEDSVDPRQTEESARTASPFGDIAPALAKITDEVLFGEVWDRPGLSARDRSLVTVASLISLYRVNELPFHLRRALDNGVTRQELAELVTHLAFYSGWPTASTAIGVLRQVLAETPVSSAQGG